MAIDTAKGTTSFQDPTGFGLTDPGKTDGYEKTINGKNGKQASASSQLAKVMLPANMVDIGRIGASLTPPNYGTPAVAEQAQTAAAPAKGGASSPGGITIRTISPEHKKLLELAKTNPELAYQLAREEHSPELLNDIRKIMTKQRGNSSQKTSEANETSSSETPVMVIASDASPSHGKTST